MPTATWYVPAITWPNHTAILDVVGVPAALQLPYRYYDAASCGLDLAGLLADLSTAPPNSVVLLHMCAHNPTGVDPTLEQWEQIFDVIQANNLFPLFDAAYQGFATGSLSGDAASLRRAVDRNIECVVTQSFAKNMGLYGERVGAMHVVCADVASSKAVDSQIKIIVRAAYSNPPAHGAHIVSRILRDPAMFVEWERDLQAMSGRIIRMRQLLHAALLANGTPSPVGNWNHILNQIGMFSFTG